LREDLEDKIRHQLEFADQVQGFQVYADTNSGFGSLAIKTIRNVLKDEAPKSVVYLYSVKNKTVFPKGEDEAE
jgi:hypothetical protein